MRKQGCDDFQLVENNDIELQRYETEGRKVVLYFDKVCITYAAKWL